MTILGLLGVRRCRYVMAKILHLLILRVIAIVRIGQSLPLLPNEAVRMVHCAGEAIPHIYEGDRATLAQ